MDIIISVLNHEYDYDLEKEIQEEQHSILGQDLKELDLSVRAYNGLMRYFTFNCGNFGKKPIAYPKVKDLCDMTEEDLTKVRNLGLKSQKEIKEKLESLGLHLKNKDYDE